MQLLRLTGPQQLPLSVVIDVEPHIEYLQLADLLVHKEHGHLGDSVGHQVEVR